MKKWIIFLMILWNIFWVTYAQNLEVKANIPSGTYSFPIEINLLVNDKDAKIFYYTDGEWRMDHIKEFNKPIILKENTQLDFYATTKNYEDTLIQTLYYTFDYSKKIILQEKNGKLVIKNNSSDIQNIWYWKIEANNLSYELSPNTYLESWEIYNTQYSLQNDETAQLYSPDNIKKQSFHFKKEIPKTQEIDSPKTQKVSQTSTVSQTQETPNETKSWTAQEPLSIQPIANTWETSTSSILWETRWSVLDTSGSESKNEKSKNLLYILAFLGIFTLYNIWLFLKKNWTFEQMKTKINKIWKK